MKLFVDDIRSAPDSSWTVVRSVTDAIRMLSRLEFDEISLDHDISHYENLDEKDIEQKVYACNETFEPVARYIVEKYWLSKQVKNGLTLSRLCFVPKITVHSANPIGAENIYTLLKDVGIPSTIKKYG